MNLILSYLIGNRPIGAVVGNKILFRTKIKLNYKVNSYYKITITYIQYTYIRMV